MAKLPPHLLVEILSRLDDSYDLARSRVALKILDSVAPEVRWLKLQCSYVHYAKSRSPLTRFSRTPFKNIFRKLISDTEIIEEISIGVEKTVQELKNYELDDDDEDDLYLTDANFVEDWLPKVCERLKSLSISDFWIQSCWRRSTVLSLISSHCLNLCELEIKNAWLSVDGLSAMRNLTNLTLEFIRLDDKNLSKLNECFPSLQVLNLFGVGGLEEPRVYLSQLKICRWTVSSAPTSITINAPNLIKLELKCVKPNMLAIETPLLAELRLSLERPDHFIVKDLCNLRKLHLESADLRNLLGTFPFGRTITSLTVASTRWGLPLGVTNSSLELLFSVFPNVTSLTLTSGAWSEFEACPKLEASETNVQMESLKKLTAYLMVNDIEATFSAIVSILENCLNLSDMALLVHRDVVFNVTSNLISRCMAYCSKVRWKWGMWKDGTKDAWDSDAI